MFLMTSIINFGVQSENTADFNLWKKSSISTKKAAINVAPAGTESVLDNMSYTVKNGDTLETIAVKYYGVASQSNIQKLQKANNIKNPHNIRLGQKLTIPVGD
ncbi:MAG: LysM peptidoglycan-binding domain-containing protein [bacterium]|nr:LysM peptidoglycan-binding domain-containing protein [bacterium]